MRLLLVFTILFACLTLAANAWFWDGWFSGSTDEEKEQTQTVMRKRRGHKPGLFGEFLFKNLVD
jgi:hypothetical protein